MGILVTGGAGFIGSFLANSLSSRGDEVRVIDDGSTGQIERLRPSIKVFKEDISSLAETDWLEFMEPGDTIFHLAARKLNTPGVSDSQLLSTNLESTIALARAAKTIAARKIVFASSLYAYGHAYRGPTREVFMPLPQTLYGMTKLAGEHALTSVLHSSKVDWVSARLYFVFGPKQFPGSGYKSVIVKNFERIREGLQPIIHGSGSQELDYVFVDDVVSALVRMSETETRGEVYNVSSGRGVSIRHLTDLMLQVANRPTLEPIFAEQDWTEGTSRVGSNLKLAHEIGWEPLVTLKSGLEKTWLDICLCGMG